MFFLKWMNLCIPPACSIMSTPGDNDRMNELEMYNWEEYEKRQERLRLQQYQPENTGEATKIEQVSKKFSPWYGEARTEKNSEQ